MNSGRRRKVVIFLVGLAVIWVVLVGLRFFMSRHDYDQVLHGNKPTFAMESWLADDGGSVGYQGVGYELTALQRFRGEDGLPIGYDKGPILEYKLNWLLLPLADKKEIRFEPMPQEEKSSEDAGS